MKSFLASMILYSIGCLTAHAQRSDTVPEYMGFSMAAQSGNTFVEEGKVWHMSHDDHIPNNVSYYFDYFIQGDTLIATNECKKFYAYNEDGKQQTVYKMALYEQEGLFHPRKHGDALSSL